MNNKFEYVVDTINTPIYYKGSGRYFTCLNIYNRSSDVDKNYIIDFLKKAGAKTIEEIYNEVRKEFNTMFNNKEEVELYKEYNVKNFVLASLNKKGTMNFIIYIFEYAVKNKIDINHSIIDGTTLQLAAKKDQLEIAKYLVEKSKVDIIGKTDNKNRSSLHYAARYSENNVDLLQFLIDNYIGKDIKEIINQETDDGYTPLDCAYKYNKSSVRDTIVALLRRFGGKANRHDKNGNEVANGKGDLNDPFNNETNVEKLEKLYKQRYKNGTASVLACELGRLKDVELIITKVGDIYAKGKNRQDIKITPLQATITEFVKAREKRIESDKSIYENILKYFLRVVINKYKDEYKDEHENALVCACNKNNLQDVKVLVEINWHLKGIGWLDENLWTLLEAAVKYQRPKIVTYLLKYFFTRIDLQNSINHLNSDEKTPLDIAYELAESDTKNDIIKLLRQYDGKANFYDKNGVNVGKGKGYLNGLYDNVTIKF